MQSVLVSFRPFRQKIADFLESGSGHRHFSRADELLYGAAYAGKFLIKGIYSLTGAGQFHDDEIRGHFHDMRIVSSQQPARIFTVLELVGRNLEHRDLALENLVIRIAGGVYHVHFLVYLLEYLVDILGRSLAADREFMHVLHRRSRYVQTFDIDLQSRKNGCYLVQDSGKILGMHYYGV